MLGMRGRQPVVQSFLDKRNIKKPVKSGRRGLLSCYCIWALSDGFGMIFIDPLMRAFRGDANDPSVCGRLCPGYFAWGRSYVPPLS